MIIDGCSTGIMVVIITSRLLVLYISLLSGFYPLGLCCVCVIPNLPLQKVLFLNTVMKTLNKNKKYNVDKKDRRFCGPYHVKTRTTQFHFSLSLDEERHHLTRKNSFSRDRLKRNFVKYPAISHFYIHSMCAVNNIII